MTSSDGNIILFIDEIHTLVGAGGGEGAMDAANVLKPALARGELRAIGATTLDKYQKYIKRYLLLFIAYLLLFISYFLFAQDFHEGDTIYLPEVNLFGKERSFGDADAQKQYLLLRDCPAPILKLMSCSMVFPSIWAVSFFTAIWGSRVQ